MAEHSPQSSSSLPQPVSSSSSSSDVSQTPVTRSMSTLPGISSNLTPPIQLPTMPTRADIGRRGTGHGRGRGRASTTHRGHSSSTSIPDHVGADPTLSGIPSLPSQFLQPVSSSFS